MPKASGDRSSRTFGKKIVPSDSTTMNAKLTLSVAIMTLFFVGVLFAQDSPPVLLGSVAATSIPGVSFKIEIDGLILIKVSGSNLGDAVHRGQLFTIRDGETLRFYDQSNRTRYEVIAHLSDKPPELRICTSVPMGKKGDFLNQVTGGERVRVSRIPIK